MANTDRPIKSVIKAVSWRVVATLTTMSLVFIFTGQIILALSVGILESFTKILLYYFHERAWNKTKWGTYYS